VKQEPQEIPISRGFLTSFPWVRSIETKSIANATYGGLLKTEVTLLYRPLLVGLSLKHY